MVNTSEDLTARLTRKEKKRRKRQKPQGTTDSNQSDARNRTLDQRSSDGCLEEDSWEEMEPNRYASRIIRDKRLQEIIEQVAKGNLQQYWIFVTNLCAISRYLLEEAPSLIPGVKEYVGRHMESGDALLTFIRHGPHPDMIAQNYLPTLWSTEDLKEPANKPNSPNRLLASPSSDTPMARQPATMVHPEGVEGRPTYADRSPRVPQTAQAIPAGIIQRPVLPGSTPTHQETGQQPTHGQAPSGTAPEIQSTAGPNFTSYGQQPPLVSTTGPASAPMGPNLPPIGHSTSAARPGQTSSYIFDAAHQSSAVQPFSLPTTQHAQQSGSVVNSGVQPGMAQPFQMHAAHPPQPTPPNVAPMQSQAPAIHPASMQRHTGQAGPGWPVGGLSQPQLQGIQAQSGPAVSRDGVQPSAVLPGHQWALNPGGSTQMPNQVPMQQGNATVQSLPQVQAAYGQSGPLNMPAQLSAAQCQTEAAPHPLWPDQSQVTDNDFLSLGIPPMFQ